MKYGKTVILKNGEALTLRHGSAGDGGAVLAQFILTHEETDYLLSYPDEIDYTEEGEENFLLEKEQSERSVEILAILKGEIVGTAGVDTRGSAFKTRHRAEFGVAVLKKYQGLGIGRALTEAAIECARSVGYTQLELEVMAENVKAISLYKKCGFTEYGRDPRGFRMRDGRYAEIVHMRLEM